MKKSTKRNMTWGAGAVAGAALVGVAGKMLWDRYK